MGHCWCGTGQSVCLLGAGRPAAGEQCSLEGGALTRKGARWEGGSRCRRKGQSLHVMGHCSPQSEHGWAQGTRSGPREPPS